MNKKVIAGGTAVILFIVAAVLIWPRGGTPVDKKKAVDRYRRDAITSKGDNGEPSQSVKALVIPGVGVYSYAATGNQNVKFGPLPADSRVLPAEISGSVKVVDPSAVADATPSTDAKNVAEQKCFSFELALVEEHIEETTSCVRRSTGGDSNEDGSGGIELLIAQQLKRMKVITATATATLSCETPLIVRAGVADKDLPCELTLAGGPINVATDLSGTLTVGDVESITVGSESVKARPVTLEYKTKEGKVSGVWSEKTWMAESDWLPVKFVRHIDLQGPAIIQEDSELTLKALEPTT